MLTSGNVDMLHSNTAREDKSAESPPKRLTTVKSTKKEKLKRLLFFCTRNRGRTIA